MAAAIARLRRYENVKRPFDGPGWEDALRVLTATVHEHPADGLAVLELTDTLSADIIAAVINGWSAVSLDQATAVAVLRRIGAMDLPLLADSVAELLIGGFAESASATKWHLMPEARQLATVLWDVLGPGDPPSGGTDWFALAINRPAGHIADFWIRAVHADWTAAGDAWDGLPPEVRQPLETVLSGVEQPTWLAQTVLTSRLSFFFAADRSWCERFLLPLMRWTGDQEQAVRAWTGYLAIGRITDDLFEAGLRDAYLDTVVHAGRFPANLGRVLLAHLAAIVVYSSRDPLTWVDVFTARADDEQRVAWIDEVADNLARLEPDAVEQQWQRWMRRYWERRLDGVPTALTKGEASALVSWVPLLTASLEAGVNLATRHPAGFNERRMFDGWSDERLVRQPALFARLLAHVLKATTRPIWDLERVIAAIEAGVGPAIFVVIRDEALRLGYRGRPA
ncbi:hypothetical protein [Dactylosporangium sp. NPDC051541]|uniref:hypothetical protein n=1 Tax=Dactylosporangium sp. NPDC051541 TaxID=3363977 RepID=UPI0037912AEE